MANKKAVKGEILEKMAALIAAGFGLVAALAWNSTIQNIFKRFQGEDSILGQLIYAIVITIIAVMATIYIGKAVERAKHGLRRK